MQGNMLSILQAVWFSTPSWTMEHAMFSLQRGTEGLGGYDNSKKQMWSKDGELAGTTVYENKSECVTQKGTQKRPKKGHCAPFRPKFRLAATLCKNCKVHHRCHTKGREETSKLKCAKWSSNNRNMKEKKSFVPLLPPLQTS